MQLEKSCIKTQGRHQKKKGTTPNSLKQVKNTFEVCHSSQIQLHN